MTVDDAVGVIHNLWDSLRNLLSQYPTEPQTVAVRAAAAVGSTVAEIRNELLFSRYCEVYERLKLDPLCAGIDRGIGEAGVAHLLWECIDRREALGIERPTLMTGYRSEERRVGKEW